MIDKLHIKGFQTHKDKKFIFSDGVNVITGSSDSGKSSIIRSLRWLFFNRPQGDSFRNHDLKSKDLVSVTANINNKKITRLKNSTSNPKNEYKINNQTYKALRTDIPDEVQAITNMQEVNLQTQHPNDQYFLLTETPGQVAKKFNEVINLDVMDKAISKINSKVLQNNSEIKTIDNEIQNKKEKYKNLLWVKSAKETVLFLEKKEGGINTKKEQKERVEKTINEISFCESELHKYNLLKEAETKLKELDILKKRKNQSEKSIKVINQAVYFITDADTKLKAYDGIQKAESVLNRLQMAQKDIKEKIKKKERISGISEEVTVFESNIKDKEQDIKENEKIFHTKLKGRVCPLCGRKE